jgi:hypothetical protein
MDVILTGLFTLLGVGIGGLLTWLVERSRRQHEAERKLDEARGNAYVRFVDTTTSAFAVLEDGARQVQDLRWYKPGVIAQFWLATQVHQRALDASRDMQSAFYDIKALGPPKAGELAEETLAVLKEVAALAQHPRTRHARQRRTWDELLERLVIPRDALLEIARKTNA